MGYNLQWFVAHDENYYPDIEFFDDYQAAVARFEELVRDNETNHDSRNSNNTEGVAQTHLGVVLRSHPFGLSLSEVESG